MQMLEKLLRLLAPQSIQKTIKTGEQFGDQTEIVEGLSEGDRVVLKPKEGLKSGMKIEILEK